MEILFLVLGLSALAISIFFAFKSKHNASKCIASITLGILFATFFMIIPTEWVKEGKSVENPALYSVLSSLLYSFKALGGRQDIAQLETVALSGALKTIYIYINYLMFALAPILASSLVISFIGDTGEKIRYFLSHSPKCYVFSEINQNSLALAKGLKSSQGKKTLVFCNCKNTNKDRLTDAKELGAITLYKACNDLTLLSRFKRYEFCFLSDNEDSNVELAKDIISKSNKFKNHKITVNAFAQSGANVNVLEALMHKKPCAAFEAPEKKLIEKAKDIINETKDAKIIFFGAEKADKEFVSFAKEHGFTLIKKSWQRAKANDELESYNITLHRIENGEIDPLNLKIAKGRFVDTWQDDPLKIRFIDEIALFCNNLLFENSIFALPEGRRDISALLIGCGRLGMRMLKTIVWYGQIEGYSLKIRVIDKHAKKIEKELYAQAPELKKYKVEFFDVDIESKDFESTARRFSDTTFVCVATGSDDLNISTAENIYCILRRNYTGYIPPIFTRVRKDIKSDNLSTTSSYLDKRNIQVFGTTDSIFSNSRLFNSRLENLALAVHLCYCDALSEPSDSFKYKKALNSFYTSEYSRRSSMAVALHIPAKLHSCGIITHTSSDAAQLVSDQDICRYEKLLENDKFVTVLAKNEHERWNAFVRSEGFRAASIETFKKYAPITRSNKDELAKLHPCIVSWNKLDVLQKEYDALRENLGLKANNFKNNDIDIIRKIPQIIKKANELCKED